MRLIARASQILNKPKYYDRPNDEYCELAPTVISALCDKHPSLLTSGQPRTWACGVIDVSEQLSFLVVKT